MIKTELWNEHEIRFIWHKEEWWAVASDIAKALDYRDSHNMTRILEAGEKDTHKVSTLGGIQEMTVISEIGIYEAIFSSNKSEAKEFKQWVYEMLKELRQATGLEGFQIFRMLDKEHQREAMKKLQEGLKHPAKVDFIKANTIANKATSTLFGYPKMIKKDDMTPDMLIKRQPVLDDTIELMTATDKFNLDCSVSEKIYERYH
jgi:prophage antirepressor-like protein